MYKLIGVIFIVMGAGGFGIAKGYGFFVQLNNVRAFSDALQLLKCEMNYTLSCSCIFTESVSSSLQIL